MKRGGPNHPKTVRLARALGVPRYAAVGLLESLWHFTAAYARRGDIGRHSDEAIADGVEWERGPAELVEALVAAGFLTACDCHRLRVHDWHDHADNGTKSCKEVKAHGFLECYYPDPNLSHSSGGAQVHLTPTTTTPSAHAEQATATALAKATATEQGTGQRLAEPEPQPPDVPPERLEQLVSELVCPLCKRRAVVRQHADHGQGWVCWRVKLGCGHVFAWSDTALLEQLPREQVDAIRRGIDHVRQQCESPPSEPELPVFEVDPHAERYWADISQQLLEQWADEPGGRDRWATWVRPTTGVRLTRDTLTVAVPTEQCRSWILASYAAAALEQAKTLDLKVAGIEFVAGRVAGPHQEAMA